MQGAQKAYCRGRNGLSIPKWAPKNTIVHKCYLHGKEDRKKHGPFNCEACGNELKFIGMQKTDWYGTLEYFRCTTCKEDMVRKENQEPEIA